MTEEQLEPGEALRELAERNASVMQSLRTAWKTGITAEGRPIDKDELAPLMLVHLEMAAMSILGLALQLQAVQLKLRLIEARAGMEDDDAPSPRPRPALSVVPAADGPDAA